ncbi:MAG: hypothetical protein AAGC60_09815 [Acidobacteriota bacterium]
MSHASLHPSIAVHTPGRAPRAGRLVPLIGLLAVGLFFGGSVFSGSIFVGHSADAQIFPSLPDTCTSAYTDGVVHSEQVATVGTSLELRWTDAAVADQKVVLIVNGNGYSGAAYRDLADHLARNGFLLAIAMRPNNGVGGDGAYVLDALQETLDAYRLRPTTGAALVGHSRGGELVAEAAILDDALGSGYRIDAVVGLSPSADGYALDGTDTPAYLTLYGSQDEDLTGFGGTVKEAFRAYDDAGTEGTTTCNSPPCIALAPPFEKNLVHIYGADHAGLIGDATNATGALLGLQQDREYLDPADQLCITKAYVTGFLRWRLLGKSVYKGLIRGEWQPLSVVSIDSAKADGFGNPAGADRRLFVQNAPVQRRVIANFESGMPAHSTSIDVVTQLLGAGSMSGTSSYIRQNTDHVAIGWVATGAGQWIRFGVPSTSGNGGTYTHFALRVGQLEKAPVPYDNPVNADQAFWIGLQDGGGAISWHRVDEVPAPDRATDGTTNAKSVFRTVRVPVHQIDGIDLAQVTGVYLYFDRTTHGTLLVDSLEWHRD